MSPAQVLPFSLVKQFEAFYAELIELKAEARAGKALAQVAGGAAQPAAADSSQPESIRDRLLAFLDRQAAEAAYAAGPVGQELQREALYLMAVLADEVFVHLDWSGRAYWLDHLLEHRLFRTRAAGEFFYRRVDALLARQDPAAEEMAALYLMALALGFRGRYWEESAQGAIDGYRNKLFLFLARRNPRLIDDATRLFPDAYRHTLQEGKGYRLPNPRRWLVVLAGVVLAWLMAAQVEWYALTHQLRTEIGRWRRESIATAAPQRPDGLQAAATGASRVQLTWTRGAGGVTGYQIYRGTSAAGLALLATVAGPPFLDTTVQPSTTYFYAIRAMRLNLLSAESAVTAATTAADIKAPQSPMDLRGEAIGPTRVDLTWSEAADDVRVAGYTIFRGLRADGLATLGTCRATAYSDLTAAAGSTYWYAIAAFDEAGNSSGQSAPIRVATPASLREERE